MSRPSKVHHFSGEFWIKPMVGDLAVITVHFTLPPLRELGKLKQVIRLCKVVPGVEALEKGVTIASELRLAANQMTNSQ